MPLFRFINIRHMPNETRHDPQTRENCTNFPEAPCNFSSGSESSDPRDLIYAFLAFQKHSAGSRFTADYTLSVAEAYRKFYMNLVPNTGSLKHS